MSDSKMCQVKDFICKVKGKCRANAAYSVVAVFAWVTLATNDSYSLGALVLGHSLRRVDTPHDLVVLVTPGVSASMRYV